MKKKKLIFLWTAGIILIIVVPLIFIGKGMEKKESAILGHNIEMLQQVKEMLINAYVPDSIKNATHDASHNLMYAEPDGNDYWAARGVTHQTEEYIKTCKPCMYIDSLLKVHEERLKTIEK